MTASMVKVTSNKPEYQSEDQCFRGGFLHIIRSKYIKKGGI